jgi:Zn-finger nucleic acid-binding protein
MNCPLCQDTALDPSFHRGIEIDICPRCKGMWLDRGELDRLVADDRPLVEDRRPRPDEAPIAPPKKQKSKAKRLADLFEEVLDF